MQFEDSHVVVTSLQAHDSLQLILVAEVGAEAGFEVIDENPESVIFRLFRLCYNFQQVCAKAHWLPTDRLCAGVAKHTFLFFLLLIIILNNHFTLFICGTQ